jgi:hypothetical protein
MNHQLPPTVARLLTLCLIGSVAASVLLGGCGGQSQASRGVAGSGATSAGAGTSTGGTASSAGTANRAGEASGGRSSGGSAGSGSAGGGSPAWAGACTGPATVGSSGCNAQLPMYTHDAHRGLCRPIFYDGCDGTPNLYATLAECQAACAGGTPSTDTCESATDCVLSGAGCCGPCDGPNITAHDFIAYNWKYDDQVQICGDVACGPCPEPDGERTAKYFTAGCVNKRCVVEDLRESSVTSCERDAECKLRRGSHCCPSCGGSGLDDVIAVRNDGSFEALFCLEDQGCPECVSPAIDARAVCTDGRCAIAAP